MFFVYMLFSQKLNKYYIGSSQNIEERILRHNIGHSSFTKNGIHGYWFIRNHSRSEHLLSVEKGLLNLKSWLIILKIYYPLAQTVRTSRFKSVGSLFQSQQSPLTRGS
jgi:putative endonuclease